MHKFIFLIFATAFVSVARATPRQFDILSDIGPAVQVSSGTVTIAAPALGYNCLEYVVTRSSNPYTLLILNGNTTAYQVTKAAGEEHQVPITGDADFCGSNLTQIQIKLNTTAGTNGELNYRGFIRR